MSVVAEFRKNRTQQPAESSGMAIIMLGGAGVTVVAGVAAIGLMVANANWKPKARADGESAPGMMSSVQGFFKAKPDADPESAGCRRMFGTAVLMSKFQAWKSKDESKVINAQEICDQMKEAGEGMRGLGGAGGF